jgi:hypothetical protein
MARKFGHGSGLAQRELRILQPLDTPSKIQDFINNLRRNFELDGETCMSPRTVLRTRSAHCVEGALLAAVALRLHGHKALAVELVATEDDDSHMLAVFKQRGYWGAITQTNHAVLRYREPVYRSVREVVMSFFHEYFLNENGKKTLRSYTRPVDLSIFDKRGWVTTEEDIAYVPEYIEGVHHYDLLEPWQVRNLRPAEPVEIEAGSILVEPEPRRRGKRGKNG